MSSLSSTPQAPTPAQRSRQTWLQRELGELVTIFNDLASPGSPSAHIQSEYFTASQTSFYTPPHKADVYARLAQRAGTSIGLGPKARDLVERCREIWGVEGRREKEKELEGLINRWSKSIGQNDEMEWGKSVIEGVKDYTGDMHEGDPLPPVLDTLVTNLLTLFTTSLTTIFPTTSLPPPRPPPSVIPILMAAPEHFLVHPQTIKTLDSATDDLKGAAVMEYVAAAGEMMGGVSMDTSARPTGVDGKDEVVQGFEKVAVWMNKEITSVRKIYGSGLGA
jgi:hypothetical protein